MATPQTSLTKNNLPTDIIFMLFPYLKWREIQNLPCVNRAWKTAFVALRRIFIDQARKYVILKVQRNKFSCTILEENEKRRWKVIFQAHLQPSGNPNFVFNACFTHIKAEYERESRKQQKTAYLHTELYSYSSDNHYSLM